MDKKAIIFLTALGISVVICLPLWVRTTKPLYKYFLRKNSISGRDRLNRSSLSIDVERRTDAIVYVIIYYIATFVIVFIAVFYLFYKLGIIEAPQK